MFLVNSRGYLVTATPLSSRSKSFHLMEALLIPKLRSQFAEFLNQSSLKRLSILYSSTRVGLGYDHLNSSLEVFLGSMGLSSSLVPKEKLLITSRS